jgi:phenylacetate-CoA ligase
MRALPTPGRGAPQPPPEEAGSGLRSGRAPGALPPGEVRHFDPVETLPRPALMALQQQRLLAMVEYAYERSAFIRHHWQAAGVHPRDIKSTADFCALAPLMDKDQMRDWRDRHDDPFCGLLCTEVSDIAFIGSSSGTTGDPTLFSYTWGTPGTICDGNQPAGPGLAADGPASYWGGTLRDWWEIGLRPGEYGVFFGLRMRGPMFRLLQQLGLTPILLGYDPADLLHFCTLSRDLRPTVFYAMTAYLGAGLVELERTQGIDMRDVFASYKGILFAGEPVGPKMRRTFERWGLGGKIFNQTSFGDLGHAHDCRAHAGCHAWEDIGVAEIIDPVSGSPIEGDGRGELVCSSLINPLDPLLRYRGGDIVDMQRGPCECGRTHSRFTPVGRSADELLVQGRSILPMDVWGAIEDVPATEHGLFQIVRPRREVDVLTIRVGYAGSPELAAVRSALVDSVEAAVGLRAEIELVPEQQIMASGSRHKIPRTVKA